MPRPGALLQRRPIVTALACFILTVLVVGLSAARAPEPEEYVTVNLPEDVRLRAGGTGYVTVLLNVRSGWHVMSHRPSREAFHPTRLEVPDTAAVRLQSARYPPGEHYRPAFADKPLSVYTGRKRVDLRLGVPEGRASGRYRIPISIHFQPCDNQQCLPPMSLTAQLSVRVTDGPAESPVGIGLFDLLRTEGSDVSSSTLRSVFESRGAWMGWILVFVLGLSLNLTPCVYPMIPVTVGYFGDRERDRWSHRFLDGLFFVVGMVVVYSILGAVAGVTGSVLGAALQSPVVLVAIALILVALSGSMWGLYDLRMPEPVLHGSRELGRSLGTFGMGMTLGVVAAPCVGPATAALLIYAGQTGSFLTGTLLFGVLSLGLGLPYVFLAAFSSGLSTLPGAGAWTAWVKKCIGWLLLGTALYFIWPLLSDRVFAYLLIAWMVLGGSMLSLVHLPSRRLLFVGRVLGLLVVVALGVWGVGTNLLYAEPGQVWTTGRDVIQGPSTRIQGPAVVYVAADWCLPCRRMEMTTFRHKPLMEELQEVRAIKVDITQPPPEGVDRWLHDRRVMGVPTILFFNRGGGEIEQLRAEGYLDGPSFLQRVRRLRNNQSRPDTSP